jgi:hypothetical protein
MPLTFILGLAGVFVPPRSGTLESEIFVDLPRIQSPPPVFIAPTGNRFNVTGAGEEQAKYRGDRGNYPYLNQKKEILLHLHENIGKKITSARADRRIRTAGK